MLRLRAVCHSSLFQHDDGDQGTPRLFALAVRELMHGTFDTACR